MLRTTAFSDCVGVFEGGGVRGIAFAGAYKAALETGIGFAGTVGASAGSIAAALIAAGMPAKELEDQLGAVSSLLTPTSSTSIRSKLVTFGAGMVSKRAATATRALFELGAYSSQAIETWLNSTLKAHLRNAHDPVQFSDLPKQCAVVAANLRTGEPMIWSKSRTPDTPVAFAVRASCTVPFFFQCVEGESSSLVDGGLLANLPVFLVPELRLRRDIPALCFRLIREKNLGDTPVGSVGSFLRAVIDTVLNGTTEVQLSMAAKRQVINIPTGKLGSLDFEVDENQKAALVAAGEAAVREFVRDEQVRVASAVETGRSWLGGFRDGLLHETAELISNSSEDISVLAGGLSWIGELHIALLSARLSGRQIRVIAERRKHSKYEEAIKGAIALGADVVEIDEDQTILGTIVGLGTDHMEMIAIEKQPDLHGRTYRMPEDTGILQTIGEKFERLWSSGRNIGGGVIPFLGPISAQEIVEALQAGVKQYRKLIVKVEPVRLETLQPMSRYLEALKLSRATALEKLLSENGIAAAARIANSPWVITPPVVERLSSGNLIIIDGTHRIYNALQSGKREMTVAVVHNPVANIPSCPFSNWDHIQVLNEKKPREERYHKYRPDQFRPILEAFKVLGDTHARANGQSQETRAIAPEVLSTS